MFTPEACQHLHRTVTRIKGQGNQVGVAINPATPISTVEEVLPLLDMVLVMSVNPGASGQTFIPETLDKVKRLRQVISSQGYDVQIEVDGGVKADWTAHESVRAGATILVSGSGIFNKQESVAEAMKKNAMLFTRTGGGVGNHFHAFCRLGCFPSSCRASAISKPSTGPSTSPASSRLSINSEFTTRGEGLGGF